MIVGCGDSTPEPPAVMRGPVVGDHRWVDVTATHLPESTLTTECLDATFIDVDGDDDLDVFIGNEFLPNVLMQNDGTGMLSDVSDRIPRAARDSEDVAPVDFDRDGDIDLAIVSEDDSVNELYINDGTGRFTDSAVPLPVEGRSNAVAFGDLDGDGDVDLVVGQNGQSNVLLNDGSGGFVDATADWLPAVDDITQDLELADVDGDQDLDLVIGNEDANRLLILEAGRFVERPWVRPDNEQTRDVDLADVDGDGDLDVLFGNVDLRNRGIVPQNRLLINDGAGNFTDETDARLPPDEDYTMDADFVDLDADGDLDFVTASYGTSSRPRMLTGYRVYMNDGTGTFTEATSDFFPDDVTGHGFDLEVGDLNADGVPDFYLCSGRSLDRLLLSFPR